MKAPWLALPFISCLALSASADIVHLKDGSKREGKIVAQDDEGVRLAVTLGTMTVEVSIPQNNIDRVEQKETRNEQVLSEYRKRLGEMDDSSADEWFALGLWCQEQKYLSRFASRSFETALELDADHEGARRKLGHIRHDGAWMTPAQVRQVEAREKPGTAPTEAEPRKYTSEDLVKQYFGDSVEKLQERAEKAEAQLAAERRLRYEAEQKVKELEERIARLERQVSRSSISVQDRRPIIILRDKKDDKTIRPRTQGVGEEEADVEDTPKED